MNTPERKAHWENVFQTKDTTTVSWYQPIPLTSLRLINNLKLPKTAPIIEIGSGDSFIGDYLLEEGFSAITLLDISEMALNTIKNRLAKTDHKIEFITADVCQFTCNKKYDLWHDRAVFHFLTEEKDIERYIKNASDSLKKGGYLIIGTFSNNGPDVCSGLKVQQYSAVQLKSLFAPNFINIECFTDNHISPSGGIQNFVFCIFQRK